jgi:hypothetical protein
MTRSREVGKALRAAGYKIVNRYYNPRARSVQYVIEVGRLRNNNQWSDMKAHVVHVMDIVTSIIPSAKLEYYRGLSRWLARISWLEERKVIE